jgi:hypothetical protein
MAAKALRQNGSARMANIPNESRFLLIACAR